MLTTCVTWKDAGAGIRGVFKKLVEGVDVRVDTRVLQVQLMDDGRHKVVDEHDNALIADRVIFACPSAAAATMIKKPRTYLENAILSTVVYADDHHPATGHMHAVMHSDSSVVDEKYRAEFLRRGSNYVEVTQLQDKSINIENQYNFGVQTPGPGVAGLELDEKPVMLISHALGEGKKIDSALVRGGGNHSRAHPLYSGWNVMAQLSLRLCQGRTVVTVPIGPPQETSTCLLSCFLCAHVTGQYPFPDEREAHLRTGCPPDGCLPFNSQLVWSAAARGGFVGPARARSWVAPRTPRRLEGKARSAGIRSRSSEQAKIVRQLRLHPQRPTARPATRTCLESALRCAQLSSLDAA